MAYIPDQQINTGSFVPTTNVWDVSRLYEVEVGSPEFKELLVRLYQNVNNIALSLNTKDFAFYLNEELVNGQLFFNPNSSSQLDLRPCFRKVLRTGTLNAGANNTAHGLTIGATWRFTRIYGAATNTATNNYYPLPFASAGGANNIQLEVNATNVVVTNASGIVFADSYVILEYLKF